MKVEVNSLEWWESHPLEQSLHDGMADGIIAFATANDTQPVVHCAAMVANLYEAGYMIVKRVQV